MDREQQHRIVRACVFLVFLLSLLTLRLAWIQIFHGEHLTEQARTHYEHTETLEAQRGRIFDRNGELLASSQIVYSLVVDCAHLRDPGLASIGLAKKEKSDPRRLRNFYQPAELKERYLSYVTETLAEVTRLPAEELAGKLRKKKRGEIVLARNIEADYRRRLQELFRERAIKGVYLKKANRRFYPSPSTLAHVIGFVGADQQGREGIEKVFNLEMKGIDGHRICQRDRRRREIFSDEQSRVDPIPGKDIYLTIDMGLQTEVETQLDKLMKKYDPEKISTIWLRPSTGEVLALANRPHFDLETRSGNRRNIAVTDVYQPGSTFKIVAFGAAFDAEIVQPETLINCHGGRYEEESFVMKDHSAYGQLPAEMVFAKSSNIGSYQVARPLGEKRFHDYMSRFGFGRRTGIALTAENSGAIFPVNEWTETSFSSKVIGYEVMVTPLQMAAACAVAANGGIYRSPVLVKGISKGEGHPPHPTAGNSPKRIISEAAAEKLKRCMIKAMREGTGRKASVPGYSIAGKTGTARKHVENIGYVDGRYVVSFVGFLPVQNPELVGLIVIDDPKSKDLNLYGGTIAAPAFQSIAREAVKILGIAPDVPNELDGADKLADYPTRGHFSADEAE